MRATIDKAGRVVVPKALRDELGFTPGTELELEAVDGRLEISAPSRARVERIGDRLVAVSDQSMTPLTVEDVRRLRLELQR